MVPKDNMRRIIRMEIAEKRLDELKPYDNNPRQNDKAVPAVAESLKEFGWQQPIVIDRDGVIIAAEQLNRKCYMMELDPHYCDVIIDRWEKFTGEKARRVE